MKKLIFFLTITVISSCCTSKNHGNNGLKLLEEGETYICGFIDKTAKWVIEPDEQYCTYNKFEEGVAKNLIENRYIDKTGKFFEMEPVIIKRLEEVRRKLKEMDLQISPYKEGMENDEFFPVSKYKSESREFLNGVMDKNFNLVTEIKYKIRDRFKFGLAPAMIKVGDEFLLGYINIKGEVVIEPKYSTNIPYAFMDNGLAIVCSVENQFHCGLINTKGEEILPMEYSVSIGKHSFSEGYASVCRNTFAGRACAYIDEKGKFMTDFIFKEAHNFNNGSATVKLLNDEFMSLNKNFKLQKLAPLFFEGLAVKKNDKTCKENNYDCEAHGFIDENGEWKIPPKYSLAAGFSEGLAQVFLKTKFVVYQLPDGNSEQVIIWKNDSGAEKKTVILRDHKNYNRNKNKKVYINGELKEEYDIIPEMNFGVGAWEIENKVKRK